MQKMNVIVKISCYFSTISLQWNCAKNI